MHLESAVRLVREQVGVRSLSGLLLYQTQAKEFQVINANLAATVVKEAGLSSYVTTRRRMQQLESEFKALMSSIGTSQPDPA